MKDLTNDKDLLKMQIQLLTLQKELADKTIDNNIKRSWAKEISDSLLDLVKNLIKRNTLILILFVYIYFYTLSLIHGGFDVDKLLKWSEFLENIGIALSIVFAVFLGSNQLQRYIEMRGGSRGYNSYNNYRGYNTYRNNYDEQFSSNEPNGGA